MDNLTQFEQRQRNGWHNRTEATRRLRCTQHQFETLAEHYPPDKVLGNRSCWSQTQLNRMDAALNGKNVPSKHSQRGMRQKLGLFNLSEAAIYLSVGISVVQGSIRSQFPPDKVLGMRPVYSKTLLNTIKRKLKNGLKKRSSQSKLLDWYAKGYFTISKAAEYHKVPNVTWTLWLKKQKLPRPTHPSGIAGTFFYSPEESKNCAEQLRAKRRNTRKGRNA